MLSTQTTRSESDVSVITYHFCLEHLLSRRRPVTIMRVKNKRERVFMCFGCHGEFVFRDGLIGLNLHYFTCRIVIVIRAKQLIYQVLPEGELQLGQIEMYHSGSNVLILYHVRIRLQILFRTHISVRVQRLLYFQFFFVFNANVSPFLIPVRVQLVLHFNFFFVFNTKVARDSSGLRT